MYIQLCKNDSERFFWGANQYISSSHLWSLHRVTDPFASQPRQSSSNVWYCPSNGHCAMREEGRSVVRPKQPMLPWFIITRRERLPTSFRDKCIRIIRKPLHQVQLQPSIILRPSYRFHGMASCKMDVTKGENGADVSFDEGTHSSYSLFVRSAFYLFMCEIKASATWIISSSEKRMPKEQVQGPVVDFQNIQAILS